MRSCLCRATLILMCFEVDISFVIMNTRVLCVTGDYFEEEKTLFSATGGI